MKVAILGAGISGLALAYYLQKLGIRYDLFEAEEEVGGMVKTFREGAYQLELGPHSLFLSEDLTELLQELKLANEVILPGPVSEKQFVWKEGKYFSLPKSPLKVMLASIFHWQTKLRVSQEVQQPYQDVPNETVNQFFRRRFGPEVVDSLVQPVVASMYGGNPDSLLLEKTFPSLNEMAKSHGSVLKALVDHKKNAHQKVFTLAHGLQSLPAAIASKLVSLHVGQKVEMVHRARGKYFLSIENDIESLGEEEYDAVVVSLPAPVAADLLQHTAPGWAAALQNVSYTSLAVVHTAYHKPTVGLELNGFGALHPQKENLFSAGTIWTSSLFPESCPENEVLFSSFIGGSQDQKNKFYPESEMKRRAHSELKVNYGISATSPVFQHGHVWPYALPQPDMFILDVHQLTEKVEADNLFACANWVAGPTVPNCIRHAKELAQKIYSRRPSFQ